jgi:uncharacterized membrane protein
MSETTTVHGQLLWVDRLISSLLRIGVTLSVSVVAIGMLLTFIHHPDYFRSRPALGALTDPGHSYPSTLRAVLEGTAEGRGQAVVMLGVLLLIATPVARVAVSIVVFLIERDRLYAAITTMVLLLLLLSFLLGAAG